MWVIYSIGDSSFLSAILTSLAMFFNSSIPDSLAAIGLLAGLIYQGFYGAASGRGIAFGKMLIAALFYLLFLVPQTSVNVHDCYTGTDTKVDHVPLGPAAMGAVISGLGHHISGYIDEAFSLPDYDGGSYISAISELNGVRKRITDLARLESINNIAGGDFSRSWLNYFRECTQIGIDLGLIDEKNLFGSRNILSGAAFKSANYGTAVYLEGKEELLTCTEAYTRLVNHTKAHYIPEMLDAMDGTETYDDNLADKKGAPGGHSYRQRVNSALHALGLVNTRLEDYVISTVLLPVYIRAARHKYLDEQAAGSALMLNQLINRRNTENSIRQSMFFTMVRPLLTFFEALVFMFTPFMPLIIMVCGDNFKILGKYFAVLAWVELWHPLMTMINLYLVMAASRTLSSLTVPLTSFAGVTALERELENYLSLGGYLATSVPMLAMMLLFGTTSVLSSITGDATGSSSGSSPVPELTQHEPVLKHGSVFTASQSGGMSRSGSEGILPSLSLTSSYKEALSNAESKAESAEETFGSLIGRSTASSKNESLTLNRVTSEGMRVQSSTAESSAMINGLARSVALNNNLSSADENSLRGALSMMLNGQADLPGSLNTLAQLSSGNSSSVSISQLNSELQRISGDAGLRAEYNQALARDISSGKVESSTFSDSETERREISRAAREAVSTRKTADRLKSLDTAMSGGYRLDGISVSKAVSKSPEAMSALRSRLAEDPELLKRTRDLSPVMESILPDRTQAEAASGLRALLEKHPVEAMDIIREALDIQNEFSGEPVSDISGYSGNTAGLPADIPLENDRPLSGNTGAYGYKTGDNIPAGNYGYGDDSYIRNHYEKARNRINERLRNNDDSSGKTGTEVPDTPAVSSGNDRFLADKVRHLSPGGAGERLTDSPHLRGGYAAVKYGLEHGLTSAQATVFAYYTNDMEPREEDLRILKAESGEYFDSINKRLSMGGKEALAEVAGFNRALSAKSPGSH